MISEQRRASRSWLNAVSRHPVPEHSQHSSSPGTHVLSRYGPCFPETGTRSRHLINSHLTDSSLRLPMLEKVLNYCTWRFLLQLRHQHSLRDQEAQHHVISPQSATYLMELLLQSFIFCHYRNLSFQVAMNRSIPEIRRANERQAGKVASRQVQPEACKKKRRRKEAWQTEETTGAASDNRFT